MGTAPSEARHHGNPRPAGVLERRGGPIARRAVPADDAGWTRSRSVDRAPAARPDQRASDDALGMSDEPELPEYPGHSAAFGRIMRSQSGEMQNPVRALEPQVRDVMAVRNDELVLMARLSAASSIV